ncbi:hypothetical protein [Lentzea sp. NBRC 102530]|nr:hypothetical protein [Lentzea sp. NBRC 102530]GLY55370.1 hypothetical protein Lesp01_90250 [Lentzea sp. NBRC 102530]
MTDRRRDYGPKGCLEPSLTLLLGVAWVAAVAVLSRPLGGRIKLKTRR